MDQVIAARRAEKSSLPSDSQLREPSNPPHSNSLPQSSADPALARIAAPGFDRDLALRGIANDPQGQTLSGTLERKVQIAPSLDTTSAAAPRDLPAELKESIARLLSKPERRVNLSGQILDSFLDQGLEDRGYKTHFERSVELARKAPSVGSIAWEKIKELFDGAIAILKDVADGSGLTQIFEGLGGIIKGLASLGAHAVDAAKLVAKLISGKLDREGFLRELKTLGGALGDDALKMLKGAVDTLIGGIRMIGEVSGISDIIRGVGLLLDGRPLAALPYLGIGVATLVGFLATAGVSAPAQQVIKQVIKQALRLLTGKGLESAAKVAVKEVAEGILKKIQKGGIEGVIKFIAEAGGEGAATEFLALIKKKGIQNITKNDIIEFIKAKGTEFFQNLLKQVGERINPEKPATPAPTPFPNLPTPSGIPILPVGILPVSGIPFPTPMPQVHPITGPLIPDPWGQPVGIKGLPSGPAGIGGITDIPRRSIRDAVPTGILLDTKLRRAA